jgi:hypothetical protein
MTEPNGLNTQVFQIHKPSRAVKPVVLAREIVWGGARGSTLPSRRFCVCREFSDCAARGFGQTTKRVRMLLRAFNDSFGYELARAVARHFLW